MNQLHVRFFGALFLMGILLSCRKNFTFMFQVANNTPYNIELFKTGGAMSVREVSIPPYGKSEVFTLSYEKRFRLTPKVIYLSVAQYSDSANQYYNTYGKVHHFEKNTFFRDKCNTIHIDVNPEEDTLKPFLFTVNSD